MYPVPSLARQIESEWASELALHFGCTATDVLQNLRPWFTFPQEPLRIELMDGSVVNFRSAFHIASEAKRAIAVFTEHCGHHVFPSHEAKVYRDGCLIDESVQEPLSKSGRGPQEENAPDDLPADARVVQPSVALRHRGASSK